MDKILMNSKYGKLTELPLIEIYYSGKLQYTILCDLRDTLKALMIDTICSMYDTHDDMEGYINGELIYVKGNRIDKILNNYLKDCTK